MEITENMQIPVLETPRLRLRAFKADDLDDYHALVGNAEAMRFIGTGRALGRDEAWTQMATMLGHWNLRGYGLWAVEEKKSGALIGRVGLYNPEGWPQLEIGWALRPSFWGQGYATEAARIAMEYGFETVGAGELVSFIQPRNAPSVKVAERLGEKFLRESALQGIRVHIYGLDRATWESHTAAI